jgi:hypothetical protein
MTNNVVEMIMVTLGNGYLVCVVNEISCRHVIRLQMKIQKQLVFYILSTIIVYRTVLRIKIEERNIIYDSSPIDHVQINH